jgi:hypothetical protein
MGPASTGPASTVGGPASLEVLDGREENEEHAPRPTKAASDANARVIAAVRTAWRGMGMGELRAEVQPFHRPNRLIAVN